MGAVRALAAAGVATVAPAAIAYEHAVAGLMPALAAQLPGVRVVPLAVSGLGLADARRLAGALAPLAATPGTAVVASVDFSHYLRPEEARLRNGETLAVLRSLDAPAVIRLGNDHLDSPGSIAVLMETMRRVGATAFDLRADTSSAELAGRGPGGTTSYISGFYRPA